MGFALTQAEGYNHIVLMKRLDRMVEPFAMW